MTLRDFYKKQFEELEEEINDIPNAMNPCTICEYHIGKGYREECHKCCYYYGSEFKMRKQNKEAYKCLNVANADTL